MPKFSGKENAPEGKDDLAMALVLGAYPPNFDADRKTTPETRKNVSESVDPDPDETEGSENAGFRQMIEHGSGSGSQIDNTDDLSAFGNPKTGSNRRYEARHSR